MPEVVQQHEECQPRNAGKRRRFRFCWWCVALVLFLVGTWHVLVLALDYFGAGRRVAVPVPLGSLYPAAWETVSSLSAEKTRRGEAAVRFEAKQRLRNEHGGKPAVASRVAIAKLYVGQDVEEVNQSILAAKPWGDSGSTWPLHPSGDYDFAEIEFVALLYLFRDRPERLYPETARHIVACLLIEDGATPEPSIPLTFGLATETENHTLMKEGTRYLRNQWRFERGAGGERGEAQFDNTLNGLGGWVVSYLRALRDSGFHEFNAIPYQSYTIRALLNLEAFSAEKEIRTTARHILDAMNWQYALGSLDLRRCAPFRRQPRGRRAKPRSGRAAGRVAWDSPRRFPS